MVLISSKGPNVLVTGIAVVLAARSSPANFLIESPMIAHMFLLALCYCPPPPPPPPRLAVGSASLRRMQNPKCDKSATRCPAWIGAGLHGERCHGILLPCTINSALQRPQKPRKRIGRWLLSICQHQHGRTKAAWDGSHSCGSFPSMGWGPRTFALPTQVKPTPTWGKAWRSSGQPPRGNQCLRCRGWHMSCGQYCGYKAHIKCGQDALQGLYCGS